jgi:hypothetical protein
MALKGGPPLTAQQAAERIAGVDLPITARSLTTEEVAAKENRFARIFLPIVLVMLWGLILPLFLTGGREAESLRGPMFVLGVVATGFIFLVWQWRQKRQRRHCGVPILIEVGPDRLTLRSAGQVHVLAYDALDWRMITWSGEYDRYFVGIRLQSPLGELRLEDGCFERGADAAAAIVLLAGKGEATLPPRLR